MKMGVFSQIFQQEQKQQEVAVEEVKPKVEIKSALVELPVEELIAAEPVVEKEEAVAVTVEETPALVETVAVESTPVVSKNKKKKSSV